MRFSSPELTELLAYYQLEPFAQSWQQTALLCAVISWVAGNKDATIWDYMPTEQGEQSPDEMAAVMRAQFGG